MADVELSFGVEDGGSTSGATGRRIFNQLSNIIGHVNKRLPEIKISLSTGSLTQCRQQLSNLTNHARQEAQQIQDAYDAIIFPDPSQGNGGGGNGGGGGRGRNPYSDIQRYSRALGNAYSLLKRVNQSQLDWTAAGTGLTSNHYNAIQNMTADIDKMIADLVEGRTSLEEFQAALSVTESEFKLHSEEIARYGENRSSGTQKEIDKKIAQANKKFEAMEANLKRWSQAEGGESSDAFWSYYDSAARLDDAIGRLARRETDLEAFNAELAEIERNASEASKAMGRFDEKKKAEPKLKEGVKGYSYRKEKAESKAHNIQKDIDKWTAAGVSGAKSFKEYEGLKDAQRAIRNLIVELGNGTYTASEFDEKLEAIINKSKEYSRAIERAHENKAADTVLSDGSDEQAAAIRELREKELEVKKLLEKYTAAADGKSSEAYSAIENLVADGGKFASLREELEKGSMTLEDYKKRLKEIADIVDDSELTIKENDEAKAKDEILSETADAKKYAEAMEKVNKELATARKNRDEWSEAANNEKTAEAYAEIGKQIVALESLQKELTAGELTAKKFEDRMAAIKSTLQSSKTTIEDKGMAISEEKAMEKYANQLRTVNNLIEENQANLKKWSKAKYAAPEQYEEIQKIINSLKDLRGELLKTEKASDKFEKGTADAMFRMANVEHGIKKERADSQTFGNWVLGVADDLSGYFDVMDIMFEAVAYGKRMVEAVTEIDTAMTELKKVTDETDSTYNAFLEEASVRAQDLGSTVADVVSASADFARLGHELDDASALADAAIVYQNVGDGINNIEDASSSIISTMQAFGIEASDAMSIVDSFNNVGNNFAISSAGIGDALLNSAAALSAANNDLHESIGLIAAANTTIQDPGRVGTALKTVSMYLRAAKTEAEDAGISTEGMANSVSELRGELMSLTAGKVDIMSDAAAGEYKSTVEILRELSNVWDDLSDTSRTNITELIGGGVRNANVISALMNNFSIVEEAMAASMNSSGSALAENEKYLDSIEGKTQKFNAAFETLSSTVVSSDLIKSFVDIGTILTKSATFVADNFGGLLIPAAAGGVASTIDALKDISKDSKIAKFFSTLKKSGTGIGDAFKTVGTGIGSFFIDLKKGMPLLENFKTNIGGIFTSMSGIGKVAFAAAGISAIIGIVKAINEYHERQIELAQEAADTYSDNAKSINDYKKESIDLINSIESGTLSDEEEYSAKSRLHEIDTELASDYGAKASGLNLLTQSAIEAAAAFDELAASQANNHLLEQGKNIEKATEQMNLVREHGYGLLKWSEMNDIEKGVVQDFFSSKDTYSLTPFDGDMMISMAGDAEELSLALQGSTSEMIALDTALKNAGGRGLSDLMFADLERYQGGAAIALSNLKNVIDTYGYIFEAGTNSAVTKYKNNEKYKDSLLDLEGAQSDYTKAMTESYDSEMDRASAMAKARKEIGDAIDEYQAKREDLSKEEHGELAVDYYDDIVDNLNSAKEVLDFDANIFSAKNGGVVSNEINNVIKALEAFEDAEGNISESRLLAESVGEGTEAYNNLQAALAACNLEYQEAIPILKAYGLVQQSASELLGDATNAYSKAMSESTAVTNALKAQTAGKSIDLDTYKSLVALSDDYTSCLKYENGAIQLNEQAVRELSKARAEEQLATVESNKLAAIQRQEENKRLIDDLYLRNEFNQLNSELISDNNRIIKSLEEENDTIAQNIIEYELMAASIRESVSAYSEWTDAQSRPKYSSQHESAAEGLKNLKTLFKNKEYGDQSLSAGLEFFLGKNFAEELANSSDRIATLAAGMKQLGTNIEGTSYSISDFMQGGKTGANAYLKAINQLDKGWASFDYKTQQWKLNFNNQELADTMGVSEEFIVMMNNLLKQFGFEFDESQLTTTEQRTRDVESSLQDLNTQFESGEYSATSFGEKLKQAFDDVNNADIDDGDKQDQLEKLKNLTTEFVESTNQPSFMNIHPEQVSEGLRDGLSLLKDYQNAANDLKVLEISGGTAAEIEAAKAKVQDLATELAGLGSETLSGLGFNVEGLSGDSLVAAIKSQIPELTVPVEGELVIAGEQTVIVTYERHSEEVDSYNPENLTRTVTYELVEAGTLPGLGGFIRAPGGGATASGNFGTAMATGTAGGAPGGKTLMGELGQELYVDPATNRWRTVGDNGPEFVNLPKNAIVFNHRQTKSLLYTGKTSARGKAMASGNAAVSVTRERATGPDLGPSLDPPLLKFSGNKEKSKSFEELYKEHQHLLKMEQENQKTYLDWLETAYKEAYEKGEISLDDYWKHEEEVFEGRKELFEDGLNDVEHKISILERGDNNEREIITLYEGLISDVDAQIQAAYDRGLTNDDEYVQELLDKRYEYEDEVKDIEDRLQEDAENAVKDLVDYRIDMLKQDIENQKDALNDKLDSLRDFYDAQKEMLQDARDEEKYIEEQSEKRKAVSDIEEELARLERDNSAWAQKRKLELQEDLKEANKELEDFEEDHAYDQAMDMLDKQYENQETLIQDQIDALDEKLNDPDALYNQALTDVQNNTALLYEEMVDFNNKYGTGNDEDVKKMWDESDKSLDAYAVANGTPYKGIILVDSQPLPEHGYATGTANASKGLHLFGERGSEYIFETQDGKKYKMFNGGEKVLNAKATNFLYDFANNGHSVIGNIYSDLIKGISSSLLSGFSGGSVQISSGDIIVQGNADQATVSELRRLKRDEMQWILKEFNKMNKRA